MFIFNITSEVGGVAGSFINRKSINNYSDNLLNPVVFSMFSASYYYRLL